MTWTVSLPRTGKNKGYYTQEIRTLNGTLVAKDSELAHDLASSNVKFSTFVASIRKVAENAYPNARARPSHINELMGNTNWANHGEKNTKYTSTEVDVDHCDKMVELFTKFVEEYDIDDCNGQDDGHESDDKEIDALSSALSSKATVGALASPSSDERECSECKYDKVFAHQLTHNNRQFVIN